SPPPDRGCVSGDGRRMAEYSVGTKHRAARLMVTVLRTTDDVLSWAGLLVEPPLRAAVGRLPEPSREVAELQFGWHDDPRAPATGPGSAASRPAPGSSRA